MEHDEKNSSNSNSNKKSLIRRMFRGIAAFLVVTTVIGTAFRLSFFTLSDNYSYQYEIGSDHIFESRDLILRDWASQLDYNQYQYAFIPLGLAYFCTIGWIEHKFISEKVYDDHVISKIEHMLTEHNIDAADYIYANDPNFTTGVGVINKQGEYIEIPAP